MGIIHVLDERVANQIAAGEVIERPLSAVKELVENAIDAEATTISVEIEGGGVDLIRVSDDGRGILKEDLPLAIRRHATSKIESFNDVYKLSTFGFRGEALASIAAISRVKITSGTNPQEAATALETEPNGSQKIGMAPPRKGTVVEVRDLYFNVPARKKFVKSAGHEAALIHDFICKMAMGCPDICFTFANNGEVQFTSNNLSTTKDVMAKVYPDCEPQAMIAFHHDDFYQKMAVEGWFCPIHVTRKTRAQMVYFVNNRLIESSELDRIVDEAVYTLIPKGRFPVCVLRLTLPAFNIDVNVHPSKKLIKFKNLDEWKEALVSLIKEELWLTKLDETITLANKPTVVELDEKPMPVRQTLDFKEEAPSPAATSLENMMKARVMASSQAESVAEPTVAYAPAPQTLPPMATKMPDVVQVASEPEEMTPEKDATLTKENLLNLEYIGQLNDTFILAQDRKNLYIIDQHTMHERILYERFMEEARENVIKTQPLLHPELLTLTPMQEDTLIKNIMTFAQMGFVFEKKGPLAYAITALPAVLSKEKNLAGLVHDFLDELEDNYHQGGVAKLTEEAIILASCKAAVKAHYKLGEDEVKNYLLPALCRLENAHTCPHGRPIIMSISMNELYSYFKRGHFNE